MSGDEADQALARIEAALSRIEAASARVPQGESELAARHARLRGEVTAAMRELDALIADRET